MEGNTNLVYEANVPEAKDGARMLLSFSGSWNADGVSTTLTDLIKDQLGAGRVAWINRCSFYRDFFSRKGVGGEPYAKITRGVLTEYSQGNGFYYAPNENLLVFQGAEPDMKVDEYCDCLLEVAQKFKVGEMYVGGGVFSPLLPPTKEPRLFSFVSDESLKERLKQCKVDTEETNFYIGSIVDYLMQYSKDKNMRMGAVLVEVPLTNIIFYPSNLKLAKVMGVLLNLNLDLFDLEGVAREINEKLNKAREEDYEIDRTIRERERIYDEAIAQRQEISQLSGLGLLGHMPGEGKHGEPGEVDLR